MTTLIFDLWQHNPKPYVRPCDVIESLGIEFEVWDAQPIADQIVLRGCNNLPDELPPFLRIWSPK